MELLTCPRHKLITYYLYYYLLGDGDLLTTCPRYQVSSWSYLSPTSERYGSPLVSRR